LRSAAETRFAAKALETKRRLNGPLSFGSGPRLYQGDRASRVLRGAELSKGRHAKLRAPPPRRRPRRADGAARRRRAGDPDPRWRDDRNAGLRLCRRPGLSYKMPRGPLRTTASVQN
jgi:hypothetical protein